MKKVLLVSFITIFSLMSLTSCMSIFTNARQTITFTGDKGVKLYDGTNNVMIGEISDDGMTTVKLRKKISDKIIIAKKDGFKNTPVVINSEFNTKSLWNILFWPGFLIDLGTGKINKYEPTVYNVEMEESK